MCLILWVWHLASLFQRPLRALYPHRVISTLRITAFLSSLFFSSIFSSTFSILHRFLISSLSLLQSSSLMLVFPFCSLLTLYLLGMGELPQALSEVPPRRSLLQSRPPDDFFFWLILISTFTIFSCCLFSSIFGPSPPSDVSPIYSSYHLQRDEQNRLRHQLRPLLSPPKHPWLRRDFLRCRRAHRRRRDRLFRLHHAFAFVGDSSVPDHLDSRLRGTNNRGLHLIHDSGCNRNLLCATTSPLLPYLANRRPAPTGSVTVGGGRRLCYREQGELCGVTFTTVPDLHYDLFSATAAAKRGVTSVIDYSPSGDNRSYLWDKRSGNITPLLEHDNTGLLYIPMNFFLPSSSRSSSASQSSGDRALVHDVLPTLGRSDADYLIHRRLGHAPGRVIRQLHRAGTKGVLIRGPLPDWCKSCHTAKHRRENIPPSAPRHPDGLPGQHLHSDLCSVRTPALGGYKYALTVVDENGDYYYIRLLRSKASTLRALREVAATSRQATGNDVLTWTFDRGSEFTNASVRAFLRDDLRAIPFYANVEAPWQNGLAERSFGVLFSMARAMLHDASAPKELWGRALLHACYVRNRLPSSKLHGLSPEHARTGSPCDLRKLRVFGCPCMVHVRQRNLDDPKVSERSQHCIFVGMSPHGNGWLFLPPSGDSFLTVPIDSADAKFNELFRPMKGPGNVTHPSGLPHDVTSPSFESVSGPSRSPPSPSPPPVPDVDGFFDCPDVDEPLNSEPTFVELDFMHSSHPAPSASPPASRTTSPASPALGSASVQRASSSSPSRIPRVPGSTVRQPHPLASRSSSRSRRGPALRFDPALGPRISQHVPNRRGPLASTWDNDVPPDSAFLALSNRASIVDRFLATCLSGFALFSSPDAPPLDQAPPCASTFPGDPVRWSEIQAMKESEADRYKEATMKELRGLKEKCITLVKRSSIPQHTRIYNASVHWVTKFVNGSYDKTKCRACFAGNTFDKSGTDCFSPVAKFISVLIVLCLSAMFGWYVTGLDYEMAYLNAPMDEPCYMRSPTCMKEYDEHGNELFWLCRTAIYGHPKSSGLWQRHLATTLMSNGFRQLQTDQCVFISWKGRLTFSIVVISTDDCIVASNDSSFGDETRAQLLQLFPGKDFGTLTAFCGVKITQSPAGISISLRHYLDSLFRQFNIEPLPSGTTSPLKFRPRKSECPDKPDPVIKSKYLRITGMLIWVFTHVRLDISWPIHAVTRVMHNPASIHLDNLLHLCRYLRSTAHWDLCYHRDPRANCDLSALDFVFYVYADSSHADDPETMCSTAGYHVLLGHGQGSVCTKTFAGKSPALSSTEAEYVAASIASREGLWVSQFIAELGIFKTVRFDLYEDSSPCMNALRRNVSDSRFKHIRIFYHFIRDVISQGLCNVCKIGTADQLADLCTKLLPSRIVRQHSLKVLGRA